MKFNVFLLLIGAVSVSAIKVDSHHHHKNKQSKKGDVSIFSKYEDKCTLNLERLYSEESAGTFAKVDGKGKPFEDPDFPASQSSLFWDTQIEFEQPGNTSDVIRVYKHKVDSWARPSELVKGGNPDLWGSQGVQPAAIQQGMLGDCWFLAAAAALAEFPDRVKKIFTNKDYSKEGIFEVALNVKGEQVKLQVDDRIPVSENKKPVNSRQSPFGAWWLVILEKAFAKLNVNYSSLNGGLTVESLRALTGMPVQEYKSSDQHQDEMWEIIHSGQKKNYVMTASCIHSIHGLISGHAYTLVDTVELTDKKHDKPIRLIKMRNPWGKEKYVGPWSDEDDRWTDDLKAQTNHTVADDGIFYMKYTDFQKAFAYYQIAMYWDSWKTEKYYQEGHHGKQFNYFLKNPADQQVVITLDYLSPRMIPDGCDEPEVFYNIYLKDSDGKTIDVAGISRQTAYGQIVVDELMKGDYQLMVINWKDASVKADYSLTTYATDEAVKIVDTIGFLEDDLKSVLEKGGGKDNEDVTHHTKDDVESWTYFNKEKDTVTIKITKLEQKRDVQVSFEFLTEGGFPWQTLKSNTNWREGAKAMVVSETRGGKPTGKKHYKLVVNCGHNKTTCIYQIPKMQRYVKTKFD